MQSKNVKQGSMKMNLKYSSLEVDSGKSKISLIKDENDDLIKNEALPKYTQATGGEHLRRKQSKGIKRQYKDVEYSNNLQNEVSQKKRKLNQNK